jgi:hypothetical protein
VSVPAKSGIVKKLVIAFVVVAVVVLVVVLSVWNKNEPAPAAAVSSGAASAGTAAAGAAASAGTAAAVAVSAGVVANATAVGAASQAPKAVLPINGNYVQNGTFESPTVPEDKPSIYNVPTNWTVPPNSNRLGKHMMLIAVARSGNTTWGSVRTKTPQYLLLQSHAVANIGLDETGIDTGPYVQQTISGLTVGASYKVSLSAVLRPMSQGTGYFAVLWEETALYPKTLMAIPVIGAATEPYGPFKVKATKTSHTLRIVFTGPKGKDTAVIVENVMVVAA